MECGKVPLGILLRGRLEGKPFESLLRVALSAIAAATREAWSFRLTTETVVEFKSIEASGSFSKDSNGGGNDEGAAISGRSFDDEDDSDLK